MLHFQHGTTAERQRPLRNYALISILLVLIAGSFACASSQDGPQQTDDTPVLRTLPSPAPTAKPIPTRASGQITVSNIATPTPVSGAVAASNIPFPAPTPTATPDPFVTPTATAAPKPSPTPTATPVPIPTITSSPEDEARVEAFYENFISISYEASFDMPNELTESDYPVTATVDGWVTMRTSDDDSSQFFTKIDMTRPIERSIEVISRPNTLSMYLHDLDANTWYFLPENSSAVDVGPLDDILNLWFYGMLYSTLPRGSMQQVPDGYIWKLEDPTFGSVTATYDQAYTLETFTMSDPDGKELIRARYFDLNKLLDLVPYEDVEKLLPATYWKSQ